MGDSFMDKKGEAPTGSQAATLVLLIAILIVFYLLFIPPDIRDEILEGGINNEEGSKISGNQTILLQNPGTLEFIDTRDVEHWISSVYLYATEESKVLEQHQGFNIRRSLFGGTPQIIVFDIKEKENVQNVLLTFLSDKREGELIIKLNGEEIFVNEIEISNPAPIQLRNNLLVEGENVLEFYVSDIGWKFWKTNRHSIKNLKITADVADVSNQASDNRFIVSSVEKNNLESSRLRFSPVCVQNQVGKLKVQINNIVVYDALPECNAYTMVDINPDVIRQGENRILFKTEKGNYIIDLVKITSRLREISYPIYYFQIDKEDVRDIRDNLIDLNLRIVFSEGTELKEGKIIINGLETGIFQYERTFEKTINSYNIAQSNSLRIIPKNRLDIVSLEVAKT